MFKTLISCCCPSEEDRDNDHGDENSRLIRNGTGHGANRWGNSGAYGSSTGSGRSGGGGGVGGGDQRNGPTPADDEQAILARILQDTANNVIDVSTTDAHTVEPREYMDRARKYNQQLSSQITAATLQQATTGSSASAVTVGSAGKRASSGGGYLSTSTSGGGNRCLLSDPSLTSSGSGNFQSSSTDKVLSAPSVYPDDLAMIRQLSSQIARVVADIRVEHKEDLVVQFAPS